MSVGLRNEAQQFINVAVAEKAAALRTEAYVRARAQRADLAEFDRILAKAGSEEPRAGDELPAGPPGRSSRPPVFSPSDVITGCRGGFQTRPYTKICLEIRCERYRLEGTWSAPSLSRPDTPMVIGLLPGGVVTNLRDPIAAGGRSHRIPVGLSRSAST